MSRSLWFYNPTRTGKIVNFNYWQIPSKKVVYWTYYGSLNDFSEALKRAGIDTSTFNSLLRIYTQEFLKELTQEKRNELFNKNSIEELSLTEVKELTEFFNDNLPTILDKIKKGDKEFDLVFDVYPNLWQILAKAEKMKGKLVKVKDCMPLVSNLDDSIKILESLGIDCKEFRKYTGFYISKKPVNETIWKIDDIKKIKLFLENAIKKLETQNQTNSQQEADQDAIGSLRPILNICNQSIQTGLKITIG